jgi:ABC-2 type transport system permease protein
MSRAVSGGLGVLGFHARKLARGIGHALPPLLIPLFFFAAFAGALSSVGKTRGFTYYDYTAFQFVFVLYLCGAFCGMFTALDIAGTYEDGMGRRMMLATPRRLSIIGGFVGSALLRGTLFMAIVWGIGLATGMDVPGKPLQIAGMMVLAYLLLLAATLWGAGIALRLQRRAAGGLIILPTYMLIFMSPVFTVRHQLTGWLKAVANVNPLTPVLESGRGFLASDPTSVGLAFGVMGGMVLLFTLWTVRGMRSAERKF